MPKKYKQRSLLTKPASSAPSDLSLSRVQGSQDGLSERSVNDLIRESRRGTTGERPPPIQTASSLPPALRAVLDIPASLPPAPRHGTRGPIRLRRIPGPPPPLSWLTKSSPVASTARNVQWSKSGERSRIQKQFSNLPEGSFPRERSLQHMIMKSVASNWQWHVQYDSDYLTELPMKMKEALLTYIAIYSDNRGPNPLRMLFPIHLDQEESDSVRRLDLGNAIGGWSTVKKIEKEFEVHTAYMSAPNVSATNAVQVPDAWDQDNVFTDSIPSPIKIGSMRFRNLKHLSLAVAPETSGTIASWAGLLALASKMSTITSLSLAYWPVPTYTPNASNGVVKMENQNSGSIPTVTYGGTNFYSAYDNDWREAAGILRSLSRSLYCLKWLDLTGCGSWFSALTWQIEDEDMAANGLTGPDWNGSWRSLSNLVLAVGWSPGPSPTSTLQVDRSDKQGDVRADVRRRTDDRVTDPVNELSVTRLSQSRLIDDAGPDQWDVEFERQKYYYRMEIARYSTILNRAKETAQKLRTIRKEHGGKWIEVDFGPIEDL